MSALDDLPWLPLPVYLNAEDRIKLRQIGGTGATKWDDANLVTQVVHDWLATVTVAS